MCPDRRPNRPAAGVTLVEVVIAMVIFGAMGASIAAFYAPALQSYMDNRTRAALTAEASHATFRMIREVQSAVPNSLRSPSESCFETVPTSGGGRMRMGDDATLATAGSTSVAQAGATAFDVLTAMPKVAVGDFIVVDNQNGNDVYAGTNRSLVSLVIAAPIVVGGTTIARGLIGVDPVQKLLLPAGFDSGRFVVVPGSQQAVTYVCRNATGAVDAAGNGTGQIVRVANYGFNAATPTSCPATGGEVLVSNVTRCRFEYTANMGATQQSGYINLEIELTRNREAVALQVGAHVLNTP